MAGAARPRVTSAAEASGCLVAPPVFKTGVRRFASQAGSIPVRLRQREQRDTEELPKGGGLVSSQPSEMVSIPRAELEAMKAELRRLRREVGRSVAAGRIQARDFMIRWRNRQIQRVSPPDHERGA
jgi:hypothetical protein